MLIQLLSLSLTAFGLIAADSVKPPLFQFRLVEESAGADTERMIINRLVQDQDRAEEVVHVQKKPLLDHTAIASATVEKQVLRDVPLVSITFTERGREVFAEVTRKNLGKRLAIVIDGRLLSAPTIREEITGGKANISGVFSEEEASDLAARINDAVKSADAKN